MLRLEVEDLQLVVVPIAGCDVSAIRRPARSEQAGRTGNVRASASVEVEDLDRDLSIRGNSRAGDLVPIGRPCGKWQILAFGEKPSRGAAI